METRLVRGAVFGSLACLLAVITSQAAMAAEKIDKRVAKLFGGTEGLATVSGATKAEAFRVGEYSKDRKEGKKKDGKESVGGYLVKGKAHKVDKDQLAKFTKVFKNPETYRFDVAKACIFGPGVIVRFTKGDSRVEVLLCFSCKELAIYVDGKETGFEDFDGAKTELVALVKEIFPDDKEIQSLK